MKLKLIRLFFASFTVLSLLTIFSTSAFASSKQRSSCNWINIATAYDSAYQPSSGNTYYLSVTNQIDQCGSERVVVDSYFYYSTGGPSHPTTANLQGTLYTYNGAQVTHVSGTSSEVVSGSVSQVYGYSCGSAGLSFFGTLSACTGSA